MPPINLTGARWVRSQHSGNGGNCVEISPDFPGLTPVRDSKDPEGPALVFAADAWRSFVASVRSGDFGGV
ncbi:DUF397 domain-containing protein [Kitasatospora sp. NPDC059327]|uniref:DUF397 domain-containing protein n=1 Tax=Kitasatospora sp. NPDC059327 TaxID=3346803 RepID=UPI0036C288BE